ncbi:hypothetical protein [Methylobacterium sp. J-076]|uniref:hypothetical protein n=1 Tax=Methylobacterium sp. J-076 TaxID=2836655 RepID=UPI001FB94630|nr:hypothetical protein [Methylobacterium sp. J-076]MCJ2012097.1 hypothetical protein [Methylobacterium sp. J-076]
MLTNDLHPPRDGLNADPVLYGVAAGLAALFPLVDPPQREAGSSHRGFPGGLDRPRESVGKD